MTGVGKHYIGPVGRPTGSQFTKKIARLMGQLGSGPCLVGQILSGPCLMGRLGSRPHLVDRIG